MFLATPLPKILGPLDMQHSMSQGRHHQEDRQRNHIWPLSFNNQSPRISQKHLEIHCGKSQSQPLPTPKSIYSTEEQGKEKIIAQGELSMCL